MATIEIEIERSHSGIDWFRVVLYRPTLVGWSTRVFGKAWSAPKVRFPQEAHTETRPLA